MQVHIEWLNIKKNKFHFFGYKLRFFVHLINIQPLSDFICH